MGRPFSVDEYVGCNRLGLPGPVVLPRRGVHGADQVLSQVRRRDAGEGLKQEGADLHHDGLVPAI